jgi:hypothetical protein
LFFKECCSLNPEPARCSARQIRGEKHFSVCTGLCLNAGMSGHGLNEQHLYPFIFQNLSTHIPQVPSGETRAAEIISAAVIA